MQYYLPGMFFSFGFIFSDLIDQIYSSLLVYGNLYV